MCRKSRRDLKVTLRKSCDHHHLRLLSACGQMEAIVKDLKPQFMLIRKSE